MTFSTFPVWKKGMLLKTCHNFGKKKKKNTEIWSNFSFNLKQNRKFSNTELPVSIQHKITFTLFSTSTIIITVQTSLHWLWKPEDQQQAPLCLPAVPIFRCRWIYWIHPLDTEFMALQSLLERYYKTAQTWKNFVSLLKLLLFLLLHFVCLFVSLGKAMNLSSLNNFSLDLPCYGTAY